MESKKSNIENPQKDALSIAEEKEIDKSSQDTNSELDAEFENLRKATALKDEVVSIIENNLSKLLKKNQHYKHVLMLLYG